MKHLGLFLSDFFISETASLCTLGWAATRFVHKSILKLKEFYLPLPAESDLPPQMGDDLKFENC